MGVPALNQRLQRPRRALARGGAVQAAPVADRGEGPSQVGRVGDVGPAGAHTSLRRIPRSLKRSPAIHAGEATPIPERLVEPQLLGSTARPVPAGEDRRELSGPKACGLGRHRGQRRLAAPSQHPGAGSPGELRSSASRGPGSSPGQRVEAAAGAQACSWTPVTRVASSSGRPSTHASTRRRALSPRPRPRIERRPPQPIGYGRRPVTYPVANCPKPSRQTTASGATQRVLHTADGSTVPTAKSGNRPTT